MQSIKQPALVVAIDSDILYPPTEQQELADFIPNTQQVWPKSTYGHDAFLVDTETLNKLIINFRQTIDLGFLGT